MKYYKKLYKKYRNLLKRIKNKVHRYIRNKKTKHIKLCVEELIAQETCADGFNRYDIIVRLLAIECEKGLNNFGWDLYRRMQIARCGEKNIEQRIICFKKLIENYDKSGYDESSEIELDSNLHLIDGSHRLALALYYKIPYINAMVRPFITNCYYGLYFFAINGFTELECNIIKERYKQVFGGGG